MIFMEVFQVGGPLDGRVVVNLENVDVALPGQKGVSTILRFIDGAELQIKMAYEDFRDSVCDLTREDAPRKKEIVSKLAAKTK